MFIPYILYYRGFAKKTLLKTARRAGFKPKTSSKRQKYVLPNVTNSNNVNKYMTSPGRMSLPVTENIDYGAEDDISCKKPSTAFFLHSSCIIASFSPTSFCLYSNAAVDEFEIPGPGLVPPSAPTDAKTLERLTERSYVRDWQRLGLISSTSASSTSNTRQRETFRLTTVNSAYMMCRR